MMSNGKIGERAYSHGVYWVIPKMAARGNYAPTRYDLYRQEPMHGDWEWIAEAAEIRTLDEILSSRSA